MRTSIGLIAAERARQIVLSERRLAEHDEDHTEDELALAAAAYALPEWWRRPPGRTPRESPWDGGSWWPCPEDRIRELAKAGALIAAEIDRLQRAAQQGVREG